MARTKALDLVTDNNSPLFDDLPSLIGADLIGGPSSTDAILSSQGDLIDTVFTSSVNDAAQQSVLGVLASPNGLVPLSDVSQFEASGGPLPDPENGSTAVGGSPALQTLVFFQIVDIIPISDSAETGQNSEPSLAVDPLDPTQIIAGSFSSTFTGGGVSSPYFKTTNGGMTWSDYGNLTTQDKTIAWKQDGSAALTSTLLSNVISTYSGTTAGSNFGSPINTYNPVHTLDQPWIRTGPSNHVYDAYNDLSAAGGKTASVLVSTNGGSTYTPVTVDRVGESPALQDAPSVRLAVNGNTVYSVFTRWTSVLDTDGSGETRFNSQVVIVRSDNGGADGFNAIGTSGNGVTVAAPTSWFANTTNAPLTLGQERTSADVAIAVDPNNAQHVVIAYGNAPGATGSGELQLVVTESTDGGMTWTPRFTTPLSSTSRSALPALSILANGSIGLLYCNYNSTTNNLSQHLLTTTDDFVTSTDTTLATESNATPTTAFSPYLGDFFDLTSIGNSFYGIFCASNKDDGTNAQFANGVTFQRSFTGTPGTASFQLTNGTGGNVAASIDPYVFSCQLLTGKPRTNDFNGDHISDLLWRQTGGTFTDWQSTGSAFTPNVYVNFVSTAWHLQGSMDFNGDGAADLVWRNTSTGTFSIWDSTGPGSTPNSFTPNSYVNTVDPAWTIAALADFNGDGKGDLLWQNGTTFAGWQSTGTGFTPNVFVVSVTSGWSVAATGDFNGDSKADLIWENGTGTTFSEWQSTGTGFTPNVFVGSVAAGWSLVGVGDFTGNGKDDLVWFNSGSGVFSIWDSTGSGFTPNSFVGAVAAGWTLAGIGDYNGDGKNDLIWSNTSTGTFSIWDSTGTGFTPNAFVGNVGTDWSLINNPTHTHA
jgi:hypothetical protein